MGYMRPIIGITTGTSVLWRPGRAGAGPYSRAIERSGGIPLLIGPRRRGRVEDCQGLLASGGWDVHPRWYSRRPGDATLSDEEFIARYDLTVEVARDRIELPVIRKALEMKMPILGICRGIQSLNVVLGGSLVPDIPLCLGQKVIHYNLDRTGTMHGVDILSGTLVERLVGSRTVLVNSYHHQGMTEAELAPDIAPASAPETRLQRHTLRLSRSRLPARPISWPYRSCPDPVPICA